jgi:hypothetical protein
MEILAMSEPPCSIDRRFLGCQSQMRDVDHLSMEIVATTSCQPLGIGKLFSIETGVARTAAFSTRLVCIAPAKEFCVSLTPAQVHPTMS